MGRDRSNLDIARFTADYADGLSHLEIAWRHSIGKATVRDWVIRLGLPKRRKPKPEPVVAAPDPDRPLFDGEPIRSDSPGVGI